jgi:hypothetical protein
MLLSAGGAGKATPHNIVARHKGVASAGRGGRLVRRPALPRAEYHATLSAPRQRHVIHLVPALLDVWILPQADVEWGDLDQLIVGDVLQWRHEGGRVGGWAGVGQAES